MEIYQFKNPLYHGSRGGIAGNIAPISRERCDFGKGFYMDTDPDLAKAFVASDADPYFYIVNLETRAFPKEHILELKDEEWVYFTLYNRGRLETVKGTEFHDYYYINKKTPFHTCLRLG